MPLRDDLCEQRAAILQIDRALDGLAGRAASRNTAHLIDRARSMLAAANEFIGRALEQPLAEKPAAELDAAVAPATADPGSARP